MVLTSSRKSMRPPSSSGPRPPVSRAQTATPTLPGGRVSPADSHTTTVPLKSPARSVNGGLKRKERDFDQPVGEETNINVVVRCRGRNDREVRENSGVVVSTDGVKGQKVDLSMGPSALSNKTYHFDKVFAPAADQDMLFQEVVSPLLDEVLSGFNCTVFAYGQTGTGKTYTMSGDITDVQPLPEAAGIIPRVLYALFDRLGDEDEEPETSVKCSFIELYNEELRDLLSLDDSSKLKIFDDNSKKGPTSTLVQGMEETHIRSASRGLQLLKSGSYKRQVAATKCNDLSSRSHTIFTLTVYTKRTSETGEDYISAGKLNLVDLAGSENIQRSGAENKRAAEAGLINKSLLTLGRVINALVERSTHVPYRESKLTRLLQDSLGGRTKTLIIATLSPAKSNLEETISTLDYAFRAKNIRNKPQLNQTISKRVLLRDFTIEIEKLKSELIATRQRNGVWMSQEAFEESKMQTESQRILANEQRDKIETMEINLRNKVQELFSLTNNFNRIKKDNETARTNLDATKGLLDKTELVLAHAKKCLAEETYLRKAHQETEEKLASIGQELLSTLNTTKGDIEGLHSGLRRRSGLQATNRQIWALQQSRIAGVTDLVDQRLESLKQQQERLVADLSLRVQNFVTTELQELEDAQGLLKTKADAFEKSEADVQIQTVKARQDMDLVLEGITKLREDVKINVGAGLVDMSTAAHRISAGVASELDKFHTQLHGSYASLGRDFKAIFDDVIKRMNEQGAEVNELRKQMSSANAALADATQQSQSALEADMEEERKVAASERQQLLAQITALVATSSDARDARMHGRFALAAKRVKTLQDDHNQAQHQYDTGMDQWAGHNQQLVESCIRWRESVKSKIKADWSAANDSTIKIKQTADAVGNETGRIVESQISHLDTQLVALDEITARVRQQSGSHGSTYASSLSQMMSTVQGSYSGLNARLHVSADHMRGFDASMTEYQSQILESNALMGPEGPSRTLLSELRDESTAAVLTEYTPSGLTPARTTYTHPTSLPRTTGREKMLEQMRWSESHGDIQSPYTASSARKTNSSPPKAVVYQDAPSPTSSTREKTEQSMAMPLARSDTTNSLRTIDVNIVPPATASVQPTKSGEETDRIAAPPLRRGYSTQAGELKKETNRKGTRMTVMGLAEDRENVVRSSNQSASGDGTVLNKRLLRGRGSN